MRCSWQMHYGTVGPRWHFGPQGGTAWSGDCGRLTFRPSGLCCEHEMQGTSDD